MKDKPVKKRTLTEQGVPKYCVLCGAKRDKRLANDANYVQFTCGLHMSRRNVFGESWRVNPGSPICTNIISLVGVLRAKIDELADTLSGFEKSDVQKFIERKQ